MRSRPPLHPCPLQRRTPRRPLWADRNASCESPRMADTLAILEQLQTHTLHRLSEEQFESFIAPVEEDELVVTLLMPMERRGAETRKNPIVFKNALKEATELLARRDIAHQGCAEILASLDELATPTGEFWQEQEAGLALVIRTTGRLDAFKVPFELDHHIAIGRRPFLAPLLRLLDPVHVNVLELNLDEIRPFDLTCWELEPATLEGTPLSIDEAMKFDDPEKSLQFRGVSGSVSPHRGGGQAAFHGQGVTNDDNRKRKIQRFFEQVDNAVTRQWSGEGRPLLLVGSENVVGIYRQVNHHPNLCEEAIVEDFNDRSRDEFRDRLLAWAREREIERQRNDLGRLQEFLAKNLASAEVSTIAKAAADGRIETLFAIPGPRHYGTLDRDKDEVTIHDEPRTEDDDLTEAILTMAALSGAKIHFLETPAEAHLPQDSSLAAIFRF